MLRWRRVLQLMIAVALILGLFSATASAASVKLTKQPADVEAAVAKNAIFQVEATGAKSITWHAVSPDGGTDLLVRDLPAYFRGVTVSGKNTVNLIVKNVTEAMNGWKFYCVLVSGNIVTSDSATLWIKNMDHAAATATPVPTETPVPEAVPAPETTAVPVPTATTPSVTPAPAVEPAAATETELNEEEAGEPAAVSQEGRLVIKGIGCSLIADGYSSAEELDFTEAGRINVKVQCKGAAFWVIDGVRYDFGTTCPSVITFTALNRSMTIEGVKRGGKATTLVSEDEIQAMRDGSTLTITTKTAFMSFLTRKGQNHGGYFSSFDFTDDFKNRATNKKENGGRITFRVNAKSTYGKGTSGWMFNGVKVTFNTGVSTFKVTNLFYSMSYEAVQYDEALCSVSCTNCTFSDEKHSGCTSASDVPMGTTITLTATVSGKGHWTGINTTKVLTSRTVSTVVHKSSSYAWVSDKTEEDKDTEKTLPAYFAMEKKLPEE